jgi:hypothetical protein
MVHDCTRTPDCRKSLSIRISDDDFCKEFHARDLQNYITVSKVWANVAIPQLWGYYMSHGNLLSLLADIPQRRITFWREYFSDPGRKVSLSNLSNRLLR